MSVTHPPQQLENYIGNFPDWYQTAFLKDRSGEHNIYIVRSILEERWTEGLPTCVLSLDISQQFYTVTQESVIHALDELYNLPHFVIYGIITVCL